MLEVIPPNSLEEWLNSTAVSGEEKNFEFKDLIMIDGAVLFLCWLSKSGTREKLLIGMRSVGYFKPFNAAVFNLTVIFRAHRGQKNLDAFNKVTIYIILQSTISFILPLHSSIQKVTIQYVLKTYPEVTRLMLGTSHLISPTNFENYISNGFPVDHISGVGYEYLEMVDIDAVEYPSDSEYINQIGNTRDWDTWNTGKWRWNKITRHYHEGRWRRNFFKKSPLSGGYGEHKHTLVAEFPPYLLLKAKQRRDLRDLRAAAIKQSNEDSRNMLGHGTIETK